VPGATKLAVNAQGQVTAAISAVKPKPGDYLVTSINSQIQLDTERALAGAVQRSQFAGNPASKGGAAVVMTTTGRVLALASYPAYNPNIWSGGITETQFRRRFHQRSGEPILNRATQGQYAPGSTWKVTSVAAAVAAGYPLNGTYQCPAAVTIGGRSYLNDGSPSLGPMSLYTALVVSCDTVFYNLAYHIYLKDHPRANDVTSPHAPVQEMQKMELAWGFGRPTGIDVPAEARAACRQGRGSTGCGRQRAPRPELVQERQENAPHPVIEWEDCRSGNVWTAGQAVHLVDRPGLYR
jgi:penicillin-binding protein 2